MTYLRSRLVTCFSAVFPELVVDSIPASTIDSVPNWDSSHHFLLMQVIEEEFALRIPEEVIGEIDSFASFESYLGSATASA